ARRVRRPSGAAPGVRAWRPWKRKEMLLARPSSVRSSWTPCRRDGDGRTPVVVDGHAPPGHESAPAPSVAAAQGTRSRGPGFCSGLFTRARAWSVSPTGWSSATAPERTPTIRGTPRRRSDRLIPAALTGEPLVALALCTLFGLLSGEGGQGRRRPGAHADHHHPDPNHRRPAAGDPGAGRATWEPASTLFAQPGSGGVAPLVPQLELE